MVARRPVRAKTLKYLAVYKAFALTGRQVCVCNNPGRCPGLGASALTGRIGCDYSETQRTDIAIERLFVFFFRTPFDFDIVRLYTCPAKNSCFCISLEGSVS